ncbi:QacE family quaternary ammonium compound efflux SMR transporter [Marmoricola endophyticus]|uniref:QacE family quaternary ammonium compound efflux SMR transporter n=1 Tax=Marmoricola endophyticus TaxID=2040280 RepID=A0A917BCI8_9ACTN|nr:multidrug efflux SMR transporter [Marmoricola endophyticus]GGF33450.1 QacE family quaternary ammonium compound efflux SMR transporter [Marmoricola endophyticus]
MWFVVPVLALAIAAEVGATAVLPRTDGFTVPGWTLVVVLGYAVSAWLLAVLVRHLDVAIVYATWSGAGTAAIALVGVTLLGQKLDAVSVLAVLLIVAGVVVLNLRGAH